MAGKQQQQQQPHHRSYRRLNGCSLPPHPFQVGAWVVLVYFTFIHFSTVSPQFVVAWQPASYLLVAILLVIHFVTHLLCTLIDPADDNVRRKNAKAKEKLPEFDRTKRKHVIENHECYICQVKVSHKSKHCSACNKCVYDFDHHCKWLNNCVGGRNYRIFIAMLASGVFGLLLIILFGMVQFVAYFTDKYSGTILKPYRELIDASSMHTTSAPLTTTEYVTVVSGANSSVTSLLSTLITTDITVNSTTLTPTTVTPAITVITATEGIEALAVFRICSFPVPHIAWQVIVLLTVVLATISMCLLAHLLIFHLDLICKGMSTYDYISEQRNMEEKSEKGEVPSPPPIAKPYRANQVAPRADKTLAVEVDANASARVYNESPYSTEKAAVLATNGNANGGRYRQADNDKHGERGDVADQSNSDDFTHQQRQRKMSADAARGSRQQQGESQQRAQALAASLAVTADENGRQRYPDDGDNRVQKRKFKQKQGSATRRPDYDSAADVGVQSSRHAGDDDKVAGDSKVTEVTGGGWESDSGVGSDTVALSSVRIRGSSADNSNRKSQQRAATGDGGGSIVKKASIDSGLVIQATVEKLPPSASHNSWDIPEAFAALDVPANGSQGQVKAKKSSANGLAGRGSAERRPSASEQQVQLGHLALPVTNVDTTDSDDDKTEKNSDSSNVGMWSPQAFVPMRQMPAPLTSKKKANVESSDDSDDSLQEIPLSHVKAAQLASDATYTKPSKRKQNGGSRQRSDSLQRYTADSGGGQVNNGYSGIDDSDNSHSQTYETVPHDTANTKSNKMTNGRQRSAGKNGGGEQGSGVRGDKRATSAGSARPPSAGGSRQALGGSASKRDSVTLQLHDAPSVDFSSVTTSSEDRKLREFIEKSLSDPHLGI